MKEKTTKEKEIKRQEEPLTIAVCRDEITFGKKIPEVLGKAVSDTPITGIHGTYKATQIYTKGKGKYCGVIGTNGKGQIKLFLPNHELLKSIPVKNIAVIKSDEDILKFIESTLKLNILKFTVDKQATSYNVTVQTVGLNSFYIKLEEANDHGQDMFRIFSIEEIIG